MNNEALLHNLDLAFLDKAFVDCLMTPEPYEQPKPKSLDERIEEMQTLRARTSEVVERLEREASALLEIAEAEGQTGLATAIVDDLYDCMTLAQMLDKVDERIRRIQKTA